ncbi:MAG: hypothetical protein LC792_00220, partial [Actinobacteria bacterium]|nr:hypothetical protein [Actinomycetota bacterium]
DRAAAFALRTDVLDAMRRWRVTLRHLASAPETAETLEIGIRAHNRLIRYGARTGVDFDEAARLYAEAKELAGRLGDPKQTASVTFAYGSALFFAGAVREGSDRYYEAAALADKSGDVEAMTGYSVLRLWPPVFTGPVPDGLAAAEQILTACGGDPDRGSTVLGFSPLSLMGVMQGELLWVSGRPDAARSSLDQSLVIARQRGEAEWIAWNLATYARVARTRDEYSAGLERAQEGFRVADESGNLMARIITREAIGMAEVGLARFHEANDSLARALAEAREYRVGLFDEARILSYLGTAHLGTGDWDEARRAATEAVDVAQRQGTRVFECLARLTRAEVCRTTHGPDDDVVADLRAALALAQETGALIYETEIRNQLDEAPSGDKAAEPT